MSPALSPVRKTSSSTDEKTTNNSTRGDPKNMDKDLILKCAQRKKIKKIEEEQDTAQRCEMPLFSPGNFISWN